MDWIPYIASGAAVFISTACALLHPARRFNGIPREVNAHDAAITALRRQYATALARIRKLEAAATPPPENPDGL